MITQAMILAAGKGTRMQPLTLHTPKPLIDVAGKPLIVWHIERLAAAGIQHIVLNAGYLSDVLIAGLQALNLEEKLNISIQISLEDSEPLETAGGIKYALAQGLLKDEPFILVNGDVWTQFDFAGLINHQLGSNLAHLVMTTNPEHNPAGDFALQNGRLIAKTQATTDALTFAGISVLHPRLVADVGVKQIAPLAPLLQAQMATGCVTGELMQAVWFDVGTLERLAQTEAYIKQQQA